MLNGVSWGQFTVFVMVVTGAYYLYVFLRFYATEVFGRVKYRALKAAEYGAVGNRGVDAKKGEEKAPEAPIQQVEMFDQERPGGGADRSKPAAAGGGEGDEQFLAMQRAMGLIRQVIAQGIEHKQDRENVLGHIQQVLGGYRQLRKTEYAETINNFLIRVCQSELSMEIGEKELTELWK